LRQETLAKLRNFGDNPPQTQGFLHGRAYIPRKSE